MRLGPFEILLIVVLVIVLFGSKKIPEVMKGLGLGIREFKKGLHDEDPPKPPEPPKSDSTTTGGTGA